jgi:baseplate J-like protein
MASCDRRNPLSRSGTNQRARVAKALDPEFVKVDERETADLIMFAQRLAPHLRYYGPDNIVDGDWTPFFSTDISAILARLATLPTASFRAFFADLTEYLTIDPARGANDLANHFRLVFYLPLLLLKEAGDGFARLPRDHPLRAFMQTVVKRDVAAPLTSLIGFYKGVGALAQPIFADTKPDPADYNVDFNDADPRIQLPSAVSQRVAATNILSAFGIDDTFIAEIAPAGWNALYAGTAPDPNPYLDSEGNPFGQIFDALNYNLLADAIEQLFRAAERLAQEAERQLEASLTTHDAHTPHYGLWLAFLRLFAIAQRHLNGFTKRHLDHYYTDILRLCRRKPVPDKVHLVFELGKTIAAHLIKAGTLFKAGKDATGKEVSYALDADFVANRAKVAELKALYLPTQPGVGQFRIPRAAPVANSRDGVGDPLPKDDPRWKPFGPAAAPAARVGFALADRKLFLRDGARQILLSVTPVAPFPTVRQLSAIKASYTGPKGWVDIRAPKLLGCVSPALGILFQIWLDGEDPPVVPYDAKRHGEGFAATAPILKIEFDFASPADGEQMFAFLGSTAVQSIALQVAGQDIRNVTLHNDFGPLDPAKPFLPFGPAPQVGASLVLGSSELFSKQLERISLHVTWENAHNDDDFLLKDASNTYTVRGQYLGNSTWSPPTSPLALFSSSGVTRTLTFSNLENLRVLPAQSLKNEPFTGTSSAGFVRAVLQKDFGHSRYTDAKTLALVNIAKDPGWTPPTGYPFNTQNSLPKEPYTPKIIDFSVSYRTTAGAPEHFFHLLPFGHKEVAPAALFPALANEGELYIGVGDLDPPQRLSLLLQTAPGSANPLKGETDLQWHYLRGNEWVAFTEQSVDDKSNNLTGSGVVGLAVPEDADTEHTVLPAGLHWVRVAATSDADALNDIVTVAAQAATATFLDQGNDPDFVATPLPAGTIAKPKVGDPAIKTITQPFPSFGGRARESDQHFYWRASERLRHKDRAVAMWDYERLVLQEFPQVYLVKCINHTELKRGAANAIVADNELKPGHVLVVTVPYVREGGAGNPLRPYTDKATLVAIDRFLRQRVSPFVRLEVQNPKVEEVQVKFKVAFTDDVKDIAFYQLGLNDAIVRFLTPWANPGGADISFGGKWHKSAIIDFIEEQPYVDYVTDVEMYHRADIAGPVPAVDEDVAQATTARSILVSHPTHIIQAIG